MNDYGLGLFWNPIDVFGAGHVILVRGEAVACIPDEPMSSSWLKTEQLVLDTIGFGFDVRKGNQPCKKLCSIYPDFAC